MNKLFYPIIIVVISGLLGCESVNSVTGSLQTGLISREEAQKRILLAAVYNLDKCFNKPQNSDFIQINIYSNLLECATSCSTSTLYKDSDVNALFLGIMLAPCDPNAYLTLPKVEPYSTKKFQAKYIGF